MSVTHMLHMRAILSRFLLCPSRGAEYCDQPTCLSVRKHISGTAGPIDTKFCVRISCGRGSIVLWHIYVTYVLPVLWMTSHSAVMGAMPKDGVWHVPRLPWMAWRYRDGVWCLWMLVVFCIPLSEHWMLYATCRVWTRSMLRKAALMMIVRIVNIFLWSQAGRCQSWNNAEAVNNRQWEGQADMWQTCI